LGPRKDRFALVASHYPATRIAPPPVAKRFGSCVAPSNSEPRLVLTGLTEAWDTGDPVTRRQLLRTLFAELDVEAGRIVGYRPRPEVAAEVVRYLERGRRTAGKRVRQRSKTV